MSNTNDELVVKYKGKDVSRLNKYLLDKQKCWDNLEKIKECHVRKLQIYDDINETDDPVILKGLSSCLTLLEFELQRLWRFPEDARWHRFWDIPKCLCPKLDCSDNWPHGPYYVYQGCPLHGDT